VRAFGDKFYNFLEITSGCCSCFCDQQMKPILWTLMLITAVAVSVANAMSVANAVYVINAVLE